MRGHRPARILAAGLLLALALPGLAVDVDLRLSGGLATVRAGDITSMLEAWREFRKKEAAANSWTLDDERTSSVRNGFTFEAELFVLIMPRLGAGVASGYLYDDVTESNNFLTVRKPAETSTNGRPAKANGVPLIFSAYYLQPLGRRLSLYARAGGGWLWGNYADLETFQKTTDERYVYPISITASGRGTILVGGLGFFYRSSETLAFFLEVSGRKAVVEELDGVTKEGLEGPLFTYEEYLPEYDLWQAKIEIRPQEPAGDTVREVRRGALDLGGLSARFGLAIRF
jgi:hypothetical protein